MTYELISSLRSGAPCAVATAGFAVLVSDTHCYRGCGSRGVRSTSGRGDLPRRSEDVNPNARSGLGRGLMW